MHMGIIDTVILTTTTWVIHMIEQGGYPGIFSLMVLEGSFLPVPSEIILTFSGYLVSEGRFSLVAVAVVGALGNVVGTLLTYSVARYLGLPFLYRYGKYVLITREEIDKAHRLFEKHGGTIVFVSRLLPIVRGYIPIGAGIAKMKVMPFMGIVLVGSFFYSFVLTYVGVVLGENWDTVGEYFQQFDVIIVSIVFIGAVWWLWRRIKAVRDEQKAL